MRFAQEPVGTGPFMLSGWEGGVRLTFRRNPQYWNVGQPYLDGAVIELSVARHLQFMRFQLAELDQLTTVSLSTMDYVWLHEQSAWRPFITDAPDNSMYGISMNIELPPFDNRHVRRAIAFAIDREGICRSRANRLRPLGGILPPNMPGYDPALPDAQTYDPARARQEMALAGYPNGLPGEFEIWLTEGESGLVYGQLIQADLARIGIRIRLRQTSFAVYLENVERRHAVSIALAAWNQDFPDPSNFIETLFSSRSIQDENSQNNAFYSNSHVDALLDRARVDTHREERLSLYREAERIIVDDAAWAFLFTPVDTHVNQPYVRGFHTSPVYQHAIEHLWLDLPTQRFAAREARIRATWSGLAQLAVPWSVR